MLFFRGENLHLSTDFTLGLSTDFQDQNAIGGLLLEKRE